MSQTGTSTTLSPISPFDLDQGLVARPYDSRPFGGVVSRVSWAVVLLAWIAWAAIAAQPDQIRVQFDEVDALIANPGQGWMSQQRSPPEHPRFPYSVVYVRFNWADAEPEEGRYNWALIDDVIEAWKSRHATVALRVMTCNAHSRGYYASPQWLFDAGCGGHEYLRGGDDPTSGGQRITRIEPDCPSTPQSTSCSATASP